MKYFAVIFLACIVFAHGFTLKAGRLPVPGNLGTATDLSIMSAKAHTHSLENGNAKGFIPVANGALNWGDLRSLEQLGPGTGFSSLTNLDPLAVSANTGEKPQSKPWHYAGKWWVVLPNSSGTHLWRLDGSSWTHILRLSSRTTSKADCKRVGNVTHIFLFQGASSQLVSVEYVEASATYQLWSKRTSTTGLSLDRGVETATIDIDGNGRMWLASDAETDVNVRWSDAPYHSWSAPITLATGINKDDICAVVAMPGKIGVFWSDQTTKRFGFRSHIDGASPATWSQDEVPASQSAMNVGGGMADDHMNMAVADDGTLYCAIKTEYKTAGYPTLGLLVRRPNGSWDNLYQVTDQHGTRPIVILNETVGKLKVVYVTSQTDGNIVYKESSMSTISFSAELTLIKGNFNNPTSSKENYSSEVVILASNSSHAVGVLASEGVVSSVPAIPTLFSPAHTASGISVSSGLAWNVAEGATSYQAQVSTTSNFSSSMFNQSNISSTSVSVTGLANSTVYYWRVRAANSTGNSDWSSVWSFSTEPVNDPPTSGATLVGHWKMDEGSGSMLLDASENGNNAQTVRSPGWVTGVSGLALQLDGKRQYASVSDHPSLHISQAITMAGWIRPEKTATQNIMKKSFNGLTDGYELSLSSGGKVYFRFNQTSSGDTYRLVSAASYPADGTTWMHIAATYDGKVIRMYINGVENSVKVLSSPPPIQVNNLALSIGAQSDGKTRFQGALDELRVYNAALSASEISELVAGAAAQKNATASNARSMPVELSIAGSAESGKLLNAYPNPFSSQLSISFFVVEEEEYSLTLHDIKGMQVGILRQGISVAGESNTLTVDAAELGLAQGLYLLRLQTQNGISSIKLLYDQ